MELCEMAVFTENVAATSTFYEQLFGNPEFANDSMALFDVNGIEVLIHERYDEEAGELPPEDHFAFAVENLEQSFAQLSKKGLSVFREPAEYEWGRSAYLEDPDGRLVELTEQ